MPAARSLLLLAVALVSFLPAAARTAAQDVPPPAEANFLSHWGEIHQQYGYESWGVETFPAYGDNQVQHSGHHWFLYVDIPGFKDRDSLWAAVKPFVQKAGWTIVSENPNGGMLVVLHFQQNGVEAWANATVDDFATRFNAEMIEVAPPPISLTLKEPSPTPEKMAAEDGDFPYLAPLPGSEAHGGQQDDAPLKVTPKGANQDANQEEIVANGSLARNYALNNLSQALFAKVYHDALLKAGWTIEQETPNGELIIAHYGKNGRNLWAYLLSHGGDYTIRVGNEAAPDAMKASLAANCHVALYGVLFDFNKATLQPESDGPLKQVAALMAANPSLNIEVQGHTDNVGGDDYNQKLSEARAKTVMTWLSAHGVAAGRMTAKGYGKTRPVADNDSDEGREKNRRVEIADTKCTAKGA